MVTVPVSVEAHLCPSVQWSFKGLNIAHGDDYTITNPCSVADAESPFTFMLTVNNLTNETSGSYSATFSNLAGSGILPGLYITIPGKNYTLHFMVHWFSRPVATSDPVSSLILSVADNSDAMCLVNASTVTISCETNGFPRPSVQFLKGQEVITPGQGAFQRVSQTFTDQVGDTSIYRVYILITPSHLISFRYNCLMSSWMMLECTDVKLQVNLMTWLICHLHFAVSQFLGTHTYVHDTHPSHSWSGHHKLSFHAKHNGRW